MRSALRTFGSIFYPLMIKWFIGIGTPVVIVLWGYVIQHQ